jgi:ATP-binding cassette subfamily B protein
VYRQHTVLVALFLLSSLLANGSFAFQQGLFGQALQELYQQATADVFNRAAIWWWCIILLTFATSRAILGYVSQIIGSLLGQKVLFQLRLRIFDQVLQLDQEFYRRHAGGELIARTTHDSDKVRDAVVLGTRALVDTAMVLVGGLAYLWMCHWTLGLIQTICIMLAVWMLIRQAERLVDLNRATDDAYDGVTQQFTEGVLGIRAIKAFGTEEDRFTVFHQRLQEFMGRARQALLYSASHLPRPQFVVALGHAWCLWQGAQLIAAGALSPGTYVALLMLITGLVFRMDGIGRIVRIFADAKSSAARVWEVLDAQSSLKDGTKDLPKNSFSMCYDNISVRINDRMLLNDCTLSIHPGEIVAIVGRTGCGKSTLCSLLSRLRDPEHGTITLRSQNDPQQVHDIQQFRLAALRKKVHVVHQGSFLFSDSVRNNILLANPQASDATLQAAIHDAAAEDILAGLDEGLTRRIGERGVTLSGGQRQRICLARALVAEPQILVLDDATSALDSATEAVVLNNIRKKSDGISVLLVANRL